MERVDDQSSVGTSRGGNQSPRAAEIFHLRGDPRKLKGNANPVFSRHLAHLAEPCGSTLEPSLSQRRHRDDQVAAQSLRHFANVPGLLKDFFELGLVRILPAAKETKLCDEIGR